MTCTHRLGGDGLLCDRESEHDERAAGGHTYSAAWAPDRHDISEASDEGMGR